MVAKAVADDAVVAEAVVDDATIDEAFENRTPGRLHKDSLQQRTLQFPPSGNAPGSADAKNDPQSNELHARGSKHRPYVEVSAELIRFKYFSCSGSAQLKTLHQFEAISIAT